MSDETKRTQHTQGPWSRAWIYGAIRHINKNVDEDAFYDSESDPQKDADTPNVRINPADADLIASSPDLLKALRGLIPLVEMDAEASDPSTDLWAALHMAREAVRSAEGRS